MTTICIVQARLTSTRLPGKAMLSLAGEPVIKHVLRRCRSIPGIDRVICAVPDSPMSKPIEREAKMLGCGVFRGSEDDVLGRYYLAARWAKADIVMRVTGDCPFIDPEVCDQVLALLGDYEYASNILPRGYPDGLDCEVFTMDALAAAYAAADDPSDREHVTTWMRRNLPCVNLPGDFDPEMRLTLDDLDDYISLSERFSAQ